MENTPVAPTDAQAPASVASTNSNDQAPVTPPAEAPATPAEPTAEQIAKYLGTTPESLEKAKKFYENNGGFDKVFGERKAEITTPKSQQPQAPAEAPAQAPAQQPAPAQEKIKGGLDANDVITKMYFNNLAAEEQYANIAKEIKDGTIFDEMGKLGINPMVNGQYNDGQIREFLGMYSKTKPAAPANTPMTNTPTVQATGEKFNGPIASTEDALKVMQENAQMVAAGQGEHSKLKEASEFLSKGFAERHPKQDTFMPWAARQQK